MGLHDESGHQVSRTMSLVKSRFYWTEMDGDIEKHVRKCPRCIRRKAQDKTSAKLVVVESTYPMYLVCMDCLHLKCPLVDKSTYLSLQTISPDMLRLSQPRTNRQKQQPEPYLTTLSVIMVSPPAFTVTKVATSKTRLLKNCVPLLSLISRGLLLITPWAMECQKGSPNAP